MGIIIFMNIGPYILHFCLVLAQNTSFEFAFSTRISCLSDKSQHHLLSMAGFSAMHLFPRLVIIPVCRGTSQTMQTSCSSKFLLD